MELRKLNAKDLFRVANILNKIGIAEIKKVIDTEKFSKLIVDKNADKDSISSLIGVNIVFDVVGLIVGNLEKCEKDIFSFCASVTGKTDKEISEMGMSEFMELLIAIVKKEEFKDFFNRLSMLVKSE